MHVVLVLIFLVILGGVLKLAGFEHRDDVEARRHKEIMEALAKKTDRP